MRNRKLLTFGVSALLFGAGCDALEPDDGCEGTTNVVQLLRGDTSITRTGLRFMELTLGTGATVRSCRTVGVSYVLHLENGDSVDGGAFAFLPGAGELIPGFEQGVLGMKVGGERRLIVPPNLGYGATARTDGAGNTIIPANSTLIFDIAAVASDD